MRLTVSEFLVNKQIPLSVCRRERQEPFPSHQHEFTELVVVLAGSGWHASPHGRHKLSVGDVFLVSPGQTHGYDKVEGLGLVNVMYDERSLGVPLWSLRTAVGYQSLFRLQCSRRKGEDTGGMRLNEAGLAQTEALIGRIERELQGREPGYELLALAHLMELLGLLARLSGRSTEAQNSPLLRVGEAVSYLERHFTDAISLGELAALAHMSQNTFLRTFQRATGSSPLAYQMQLRIQQARQMLVRTDAGISEIAYAVGFFDSNYFSRQFRRLTGGTPSACRREGRIWCEREGKRVV